MVLVLGSVRLMKASFLDAYDCKLLVGVALMRSFNLFPTCGVTLGGWVGGWDTSDGVDGRVSERNSISSDFNSVLQRLRIDFTSFPQSGRSLPGASLLLSRVCENLSPSSAHLVQRISFMVFEIHQ